MQNNDSTNSTVSQLPSDADFLEFRTLSMLLTAITTINRGQPSEPPQPYDEKYHGSYERPSNSRELALNAIATLLVRYHEVFAVVAHSSQQVFAMQDGAQVDHKEQDDSRLSAFISKALNVYAVANPNKKKPYQYFSRLESCYCKIAEHGTSHYNLISDSNWDCLTISKSNDTIENHLATLLDFLRRHKQAEEAQRPELLDTYHRYMVAASYRKMYLRGTHAYSQHSLDILSTLTPENMQDIFKKHASGVKLSSRKDHDLGSMLISLHEQEELQSILDVHLTEYKASVGLQHRNIRSLIDAFRTVLLSRSEEGMGAYNEQTCFTFHLLLVATISGFIKSLVSLDEATKAKKKADRAKTAADFNLAADQEIYAEHVVQFGRLLWHFAYSQMLNLHLELLEKGNFLRTPIDPHMGPQRNPAPIDGDGDDEDNNEDTDDMPDELKRSEKDKAVTFRRWIQILVSYWAAINVLAKFNTRQGTDSANITLVHVRGKLDYKNMAPWDDIIRKLASLSAADGSQVPFNADFAIASFIERIEDPNQDSKIVKAFRKKSKNCEECLLVAAAPRDVDFVGNLHCEVLLGTILEYFWNIKIGGNKEYVKLFESANRDMIAVSKLCCPACWWFFNILRHGSDTFKLRGRHATVYTVDLPPWIPDIVLQQMMTEFRKRLSHELILMMNKMAEPKPERSSMESDSCLSTASNESGTNAAHPRRRTKWISIVRRN